MNVIQAHGVLHALITAEPAVIVAMDGCYAEPLLADLREALHWAIGLRLHSDLSAMAKVEISGCIAHVLNSAVVYENSPYMDPEDERELHWVVSADRPEAWQGRQIVAAELRKQIAETTRREPRTREADS